MFGGWNLTRQIIVILCFPPFVVVGCASVTQVRINPSQSNTEILQQILCETSKGTNAADVVVFATGISPGVLGHRHIEAYSQYVTAAIATTGLDLPVTRTTHKEIRVLASERPRSFWISEQVFVTWHFDDHDRVSDIVVDRTHMGP